MLELYVEKPPSLTAEDRDAIEQHLASCALCREHEETLTQFNRSLEQQLEQPPSRMDEKQAETIVHRENPRALLSQTSDSLIETYAQLAGTPNLSLQQRLVHYVRVHPLRTTGYAAALAALIVVALLAGRPTNDMNPAYALIRNHSLMVYNRANEILWTKTVEGIPDFPKLNQSQQEYWPYDDRYYFQRDANDPLPLRVFDVDGDEMNEVFFSSGETAGYSPSISTDSLYCFNNDGSLRWAYAPDRRGIVFGSFNFSSPTNWQIRRFIRIRRTPDAEVQLFVVSNHNPSWPARIAEVDPATGRELQTYWHAGGIGTVVVTDLEGDGIEELVFGGINNEFNSVCIVVFDPQRVHGVGPTSPELTPAGTSAGSQKYYILLPRTDLIKSDVPYNLVNVVQSPEKGGLILQTYEGTRGAWGEHRDLGGFVYTFDERLEVTNVIASSPFEKSLSRARSEGLIGNVRLDADFYGWLKDSVKYWDSTLSRFVHYNDLRKNLFP